MTPSFDVDRLCAFGAAAFATAVVVLMVALLIRDSFPRRPA